MLEYIKRRIGITDISKDQEIEEDIEDVKAEILHYCHIPYLPSELDLFIRQKVVRIQKAKINRADGVKSMSIGDTSITYETSETTALTDADKSFLRDFRRAR